MVPQSSQAALSALALLMLGGLAFALVFHQVPADNREILALILGALAGALTTSGATKLADRITRGSNATSQPDPDSGQS